MTKVPAKKFNRHVETKPSHQSQPEPTTAKNRHPSERRQPFGVIPTGDKVYTTAFRRRFKSLLRKFAKAARSVMV